MLRRGNMVTSNYIGVSDYSVKKPSGSAMGTQKHSRDTGSSENESFPPVRQSRSASNIVTRSIGFL